jgi:hypothetical protein
MRLPIPPQHLPRRALMRLAGGQAVVAQSVARLPVGVTASAQQGVAQCIDTCLRQYTSAAEQVECFRRYCWK